ncbi:MAG: ABC transporter permease subunit [Chloroflexi bacterium]|nr:ABC transporter permease subunit [Chloroflexota bacterium]
MKSIQVQNLTRDYNGFRAVDGISFEVEPGEIFGFLGPNGAGKTTISVIIGVGLLMLSGMALPLLVGLSNVHRAAVQFEGETRLFTDMRSDRELGLIPVDSLDNLKGYISEGTGANLGLVIPPNFDQLLDTNGAVDLEGYYVHWSSQEDVEAERVFYEQQLSEISGSDIRINFGENVIYPEPDADGQPFMTALSATLAIITITIVIVPYLIIEEKETKTMDSLLVSPARISEVVIGKAIAGLVYGLSAAAVVMAFNSNMIVHWEIAILAAVCGTLFAAALGLLMGSLFDNPQSMNLWLGMIMAALLLPVFLANSMKADWPQAVRFLLTWMPSTAISKVFRISLSGIVPEDQVLLNLGVVVGSATLLLTIVVWKVRRMDR